MRPAVTSGCMPDGLGVPKRTPSLGPVPLSVFSWLSVYQRRPRYTTSDFLFSEVGSAENRP